MNSLERYLIKSSSESEKVAFDQSVRNFGADVVGYGGKLLRNFDTNPMVSSAVLGAGLGAAEGALTAGKHGESKVKRGARHALYGALGGGAAGGLLSGAVSNIGRYGADIDDHYTKLRGAGKLRDIKRGELRKLMSETVYNPDSYRGGKALKFLRNKHDKLEAAAAAGKGGKVPAQAVAAARKKLNEAGGGLGTRLNPLQAAAILGAGTGAGLATANVREKNASVRLSVIIDDLNKEASFGALAAKAVGGLATGAGKAVQVGAANPALAGAALGAGTGALAAGEGNRLKGLIGGAALGAAGGAAAGKFAPNAMKNVQKAGQNLSRAGKDTTQLASNAASGAKFKDMMSPQFKNVMDPFKAATT